MTCTSLCCWAPLISSFSAASISWSWSFVIKLWSSSLNRLARALVTGPVGTVYRSPGACVVTSSSTCFTQRSCFTHDLASFSKEPHKYCPLCFFFLFVYLNANKDTHTNLMFNNGSKTMNKLKNQTRTSKNTKRRFFFVYTVRSSLFDTNSRTLTRIKNSSRTRWTMFKNQTIMKNEKSEFEKWKINKSYKKRPKLWYHLIRSSLKERIWSDHFLVGLHGPDRNPVRDSVRLLVGTPQRLRKSHW